MTTTGWGWNCDARRHEESLPEVRYLSVCPADSAALAHHLRNSGVGSSPVSLQRIFFETKPSYLCHPVARNWSSKSRQITHRMGDKNRLRVCLIRALFSWVLGILRPLCPH